MLEVEFAQVSDRGRARQHNEDYIGYALPAAPPQERTHGWLFALADGVGGQAHGEVAARLAVESLVQGFREAPAREPLTALLPRLVQAANIGVYEAALADEPGGSRMATTLVTCGLRFDRAVIAHVGDSRCYLVRHGHARLLTRDHTLANEQVRLGVLSASEAAASATRHLLSRSLGSDLFVAVETTNHQLLAGDVLVLCSDGLHASVTRSDIAQVINQSEELTVAAHRLLALANQRDGSDNISVQLVRVRSIERMGMYRGRPYRLH